MMSNADDLIKAVYREGDDPILVAQIIEIMTRCQQAAYDGMLVTTDQALEAAKKIRLLAE
ncbi:MAG TPA: hypothetical protein VHV10_01380 [Ktedonobacteraceae bacterium]|jgi:hypothetical protein|nr:hypothetical protein [Ktedonobacteraceae bacterium]